MITKIPDAVDDIRKLANSLLDDIGKKIKNYTVIDVINNRIVIYYNWNWYKKLLDRKVIEDTNPFVIHRRDLLAVRKFKDKSVGEVLISKKSNLSRKLVNFFIAKKVQEDN